MIMHVGLTVSDLDRSVAFYRDVLRMTYLGELVMEGKETELLFGRKGCRARVAYLNGSSERNAPPVELIQFTDEASEQVRSELFRTSVSEICFQVTDIESEYQRLSAAGVEFLSAPQPFDFTKNGFGKSKAVYFRDPDGIILELMESI